MIDFGIPTIDHGAFKNFYLEDYFVLADQVEELKRLAAEKELVGSHTAAAEARTQAEACQMVVDMIMSVALKMPMADG